MDMFKNVLLVLDPQIKPDAAVAHALSMAKMNAARITVLSVVKDIPSTTHMSMSILTSKELMQLIIKDCQQKADAVVDTFCQQSVKATSRVVTGIPFVEIIREVLRNKHDLVMLVAEGKGGLKERLFGTTSMHLMRKCPCPVWVVKPSRSTHYKRVLAAVDTSPAAEQENESLNRLILQLASSVAQPGGTELHVAQVWSVFGESYMASRGGLDDQSIRNLRKQAKKQYTQQLETLLADIKLADRPVYTHLPRAEKISKTIVSLVKNKKIDLLVMGTVCRTGVAGFLIGNTAEKILDQVNCSVLTVKPAGFVCPVTLQDK